MNISSYKRDEREENIVVLENGYKLYRGVYVLEKFDEGLIKFDQIECSVLENRDRLSALYQCHRSVALGEGAAHVVSTDGNYIIMEKITHLKDWYQDILEKFTGSSRNFKDYMAPYLLKMLGGIMKCVARLYMKGDGHGVNWVDSIGVNDNGEGRLMNFAYPRGSKDVAGDLKCLANLIDGLMHFTMPDELYSPCTPASIDEKSYARRYPSALAKFMYIMRKATSMKPTPTFFAHLYPPLFWSGQERLIFMESIHEFIWRQKNADFEPLLNKQFDVEWDWKSLIPASSRLMKLYDGSDIPETMAKPHYESAYPSESIRFWQNCSQHYNYNVNPNLNKMLDGIQIEAVLEYHLRICENVHYALCGSVIKFSHHHHMDMDRWLRFKNIAENMCKESKDRVGL